MTQNLSLACLSEIFAFEFEHKIPAASSRLDSFDEGVCKEALCIKNVGKIISELLSKNIFIRQVPSTNGTGSAASYNYQVLFKTYLDSRFNETFSQEKTNEILRKSAQYYLNNKDLISAINCSIKAKIKSHTALIGTILYNKAGIRWGLARSLDRVRLDQILYISSNHKLFGDQQRSLNIWKKRLERQYK
jgi:hypothetical protein